MVWIINNKIWGEPSIGSNLNCWLFRICKLGLGLGRGGSYDITKFT